jgi:hypothetical protein
MKGSVDPKNGGYSILNKGICSIDFAANTEIVRFDDEYRCVCRNRNATRGFYESDEKGNSAECSDLLCCFFCGRIFDKNTLEIVRGVYI